MFDYSFQITAFREEKVRLPKGFKDKLFGHRDANRERLISRLPQTISGLSISQNSFKPQGSSAVGTIVQTKFVYEEYDIDDGLVLWREELVAEDGAELSSEEVRSRVLEALKDGRFVKQPKIVSNAVRVFYKEEDEERHHVDFPVYRKFTTDDGVIVRELAGEAGWTPSDPTQVNHWFNTEVRLRNEQIEGKGTQLRHLIQMLKRFCRSRYGWDMPNGMKLTMLVAECQPAHHERLDLAFRRLLEELQDRLECSMVVCNLAHPERPPLTRGLADDNMENLLARCGEALDKLSVLDSSENQDCKSAREAWDWIFQSDGFFADFDKKAENEAKAHKLEEKASLITSGAARTSPLGIIGSVGIANAAHSFYGDTF